MTPRKCVVMRGSYRLVLALLHLLSENIPYKAIDSLIPNSQLNRIDIANSFFRHESDNRKQI